MVWLVHSPSASLRGLLWGLDGIALITAAALLTIHHFRRGNDVAAAGFLVFAIGETLILAASEMVVAVQIFMGRPLTPLSQPLPFFAYPFLAATPFGWAWAHYRCAA